MRINKFIAQASGMSRRAADRAIGEGRVRINGQLAEPGTSLNANDTVTLDRRPLQLKSVVSIMLNKPAGYVVSRRGQGNHSIYELLPPNLQHLKPIGRLDKDSSGLLLLTNDGDLAQQLSHPKYQKIKIYEVKLDKVLQPLHRQMISDYGIKLSDGLSQLHLERYHNANDRSWRVSMREGRNRQIRRTFAALDYNVIQLHRTHFGPYKLGEIAFGNWRKLTPDEH